MMGLQSLADDEGVPKQSSSSSPAPSFSPTQPQETVTPGESSALISGDVDARAAGLPDSSVESTGDQHHLITTIIRSRSVSFSSASHSQNTVSPGYNDIPQSDSPKDDAATSTDLSRVPVEKQQDDVKMQFEQSEPLPSLPALEVKRTSEGGTGSVHHSSGSDGAHQIPELDRESDSPSGRSDDGFQGDRRSYASSAQASSPAFHSAWERIGFSDRYRHIVTGQIFKDHGNAPQKPGPSADDILEGWKAKLASKDNETWGYVHRATGIVIDVLPDFLSEAVRKEFDVAASYGQVPKYCQGQLEGGHIVYKSIHPSVLCPKKWRTTKHPKIIEGEMKEYLANIDAHTTTPAEAMLLTKDGQQLSVDLESCDISQMTGILLITDIDGALINRVCACQNPMSVTSFFIICHFLLRTLHEDEATKELAQQVQGWFWMSMRKKGHGFIWLGDHYDVIYDDTTALLYFGPVQYLDSHPTPPIETDFVRLSLLELSKKLSEYS